MAQETTITVASQASLAAILDGTVGTSVVFNHYTTEGNRSTYINKVNHSPSSKDQVQLYRTDPKPSGISVGTRKCAIKMTRDVAVETADGAGTHKLPLICELKLAIPEGVTEAQLVEIVSKMGSLMGTPAVMTDLMLFGEI